LLAQLDQTDQQLGVDAARGRACRNRSRPLAQEGAVSRFEGD
jgi:hypothetical protein